MGTACTCTCNQDAGTVFEADHPPPSRPSRQDKEEVEAQLPTSRSQFDPILVMQDMKLQVVAEDVTQESTTDDVTDQALNVDKEFTEEMTNHEQRKTLNRSIALVFDADGIETTVQALHRPLGLLFERSVPLTVKAFASDSHGQSIGICQGWVFKSVNGESMAGARTYQEAKAILARHVSTLPVDEAKPGVTILFDVDGMEQSIRVRYQPLGLLFEKQLPLQVTSCREKSYGARLGVEPGYILKSVNGQSIPKTSYDDACDLLKLHLSSLPKFVA